VGEKKIILELTEVECSALHFAIYELMQRLMASPEEIAALHRTDQKLINGPRLAGMNLSHSSGSKPASL
jgi:hypothetical protein